jgi:PTH1 family peptidyl-tRNA hydrolase
MLLIVGLGNPGAKHARHRHNVGFMAIDAIHRRHGFGPWRKRFQAEAAEGALAGEKCLLIKPQTYMNRSGQAVGEAAGFFKLEPADILVIHDEVDLPPGKLRVKIGGGVAGHNGLRSITAHIGNDYRRARIGVGRPVIKDLVSGYVLNDFAKSEREWVETLCGLIADNAELLARGEDASFQNKIHLAMDAKGFFKPESPEPSNDAR